MPRLLCVLGGTRASRDALARQRATAAGVPVLATASAPDWPFLRDPRPPSPPAAGVVLVPDLHLAFPAGQTPGTRLVLTQSGYQLQRWLDWLDVHPGIAVVAHADGSHLSRVAPEALAARGPWAHVEIVRLPDEADEPVAASHASSRHELHAAFISGSPATRIDACRQAIESGPVQAPLHLALASACMEVQDLDRARAALESAAELAADWEAVWFEYGKLWLRADDLERAADLFARATRLMPHFSAALVNLGAALAETDRPDAAIDALHRALALDPAAHQVLNNLAVIYREQGRLDEAIAAARRVVDLAPDFVFGRYNLAHALFLQGRFAEARDVYADAQQRDPQRNPVQACRLAVVRAAAGDAAGATADLDRLTSEYTAEALMDLLDEADATLEALLAGPCPGSTAVLGLLEQLRRYRASGDTT